MKILYFLIILLSFSFFNISNAGTCDVEKRVCMCGIQYFGFGEIPIVRDIRINAVVHILDGDKSKCKRIVNILNDAKINSEIYSTFITNHTNELEITPTHEVDISDMRMQWLVSCTTGIVKDPKNRKKICEEIKPYTLTLISEFQDGKYLVDEMFNETLDSEDALNKLEEFFK
tara:strand:+ start:840 stop:1358 length:519 start_codon:yes stop_codon:yes gene_type:complete